MILFYRISKGALVFCYRTQRYRVKCWSSSPFALLNIHFLFIASNWQIKDLKKKVWGNLHMSRVNGIIAFQTKKSNLERDLHKETDIKWVTKGNRTIPHTFLSLYHMLIFLLTRNGPWFCDVRHELTLNGSYACKRIVSSARRQLFSFRLTLVYKEAFLQTISAAPFLPWFL